MSKIVTCLELTSFFKTSLRMSAIQEKVADFDKILYSYEIGKIEPISQGLLLESSSIYTP